jgi:uncharacterized protein YjiS (DUF1127 family)
MQDINNIRFIYASAKLRLRFVTAGRWPGWSTTMAHVAFPLAAASHAAAGLGGWISRAFVMLELVMQVRKERRSLTELGDAGLKDIGLNRADVFAESGRSFWDLPSDRLR